MKKHVYLFAYVALIFICSNSYAQSIVKKFSSTDNKIGGECKLLSSTIDLKGDIASKSFEIELLESGSYYLNVLQNYYGSKKIKVKVDDLSVGDVESTNKEGLDVYNIPEIVKKGGLNLTKGKHLIKFELDNKLIPQIDYISLSKEADKSNFDLTSVKNNLKELKSKSLKNYNKEEAKNAWLALSSEGPQKTAGIVPGFPKSYEYAMDANCKYTYFSCVYLTSGQHIVFETYNSNCDPVMELVRDDCQFSWMNDDYNGYESRIDATIPTNGEGIYYLRVRPYWSNATGISNIRRDGNLYEAQVPIQWSYMNVMRLNPEYCERNYFTAKHNEDEVSYDDTFMWIQEGLSYPGKILAKNDDYYGQGDFFWGGLSRIKKYFPCPYSHTFITVWVNAFSEYSEGLCDVYMGAKNYNSDFENLKSDDAIESGVSEYSFKPLYNCFSWSGGIYEYWEEPIFPLSNFCNLITYDYENNIQNDEISCFDNYYGNNGNDGNPRYIGAVNYSRTDIDNSNVEIDLWGESLYPEMANILYSHASVSKLGNNQPHGYSWESKNGYFERFFHPRDALNGEAYGHIMTHYEPSIIQQKTKINDMKESINLGLCEIEKSELAENNLKFINSVNENADEKIKLTFEEKFQKWEKSLNKTKILSTFKSNLSNSEYKDFKLFCIKNLHFAIPKFIKKLSDGDLRMMYLLIDCTIKDNFDLVMQVHNENRSTRLNEHGIYQIRTPYFNTIKYANKLIKRYYLDKSLIQQTKLSNSSESFINESVSCILNNKDNLWLGLSNKGLVKYNKISKETLLYNKENAGLPSNNIKGLAIDSKNNIWMTSAFLESGIARFKNGICDSVFDKRNPTIKEISSSWGIYIDKNDTVFVGPKSSLIRINNNTVKYNQSLIPPISTSYSDYAVDFSQSDNGGIAIGGWLYLYQYKDGKVTYLPTEKTTFGSNCIKYDKSGNLWIGTNQGLKKYSTNGVFSNYYDTLLYNIPSRIYDIEIDKNEKIWLLGSFFDGKLTLSKFNEQGVSDLFQSFEDIKVSSSAGCMSIEDTCIWIGTQNGLVSFSDNTFKSINISTSERSLSYKVDLDLHVYPNPAKDYVRIKQANLNDLVHATIYNQIGMAVYANKIKNDFNSGEITIDTSSLLKGCYMIVLKSGDNILTGKIIK